MKEIFFNVPKEIKPFLKNQNIEKLTPCQEISIQKGLFTSLKNQLICSPTGSGKTLVAEMGILNNLLFEKTSVLYIVPFKALAAEKFREFKEKYNEKFNVRVSVGDLQDGYKYDFDILIITAEKLDAILRRTQKILLKVGLVVVDEIHLLNDEKRGPTLEIIISILLSKYEKIRIFALSATIGNPKEIAKWLNASLIEDTWRPVELEHHILFDDVLYKYK